MIKISVIIPTFNSGKTLENTLISIKNQSLNQEEIEILIIDSGSVDNTLELAEKYRCRILKNKKRLPEFAKFIGMNNAKGQYICNLDSDEVIENNKSFENKMLFLENSRIKHLMSSGLKNPYKNIFQDYTNSFGDPFSYFIYKISGSDYAKSLKRNKYRFKKEGVFNQFFIDNKITPICDGGGSFYNVSYLKENFNIKEIGIVTKVFDNLTGKTNCFAIMDDDYIIHYSSSNFKTLLRKIRFRVVNNIFFKDQTPGYVNREQNIPRRYKVKKYLFIPFSLCIIPMFMFSIKQAFIYKKYYFIWLNIILSFYTAAIICWYYMLKILGIKIKLDRY